MNKLIVLYLIEILIHKNHSIESNQTNVIPNTTEESETNGYLDITVNTTFSRERTVCKMFRFDQLHHIERFDTLVKPDDQQLVHHLQLISCSHPNVKQLDKYLGQQFDCGNSYTLHEDFRYCSNPFYTVGMGANNTGLLGPNNTEFALGDLNDTQYIRLSVHFVDLLGNRSNTVETGLRAIILSQARPMRMAYMVLYNHGFVIPPKAHQFVVTTHCHMSCADKYMIEKYIKIISYMTHAHLRATRIKARHFRNGIELPVIFDDKYYYWKSEFIALNNHVTVLPEDTITVECSYNTSNNNRTILIGETSDDEMCLVHLLYYPRLKGFSQVCGSRMTAEVMKKITGLNYIDGFLTKTEPIYKETENSKELELNEFLKNKTDWSSDIEKVTRYEPHKQLCAVMWDPDYLKKETRLLTYPNDVVKSFNKYRFAPSYPPRGLSHGFLRGRGLIPRDIRP